MATTKSIRISLNKPLFLLNYRNNPLKSHISFNRNETKNNQGTVSRPKHWYTVAQYSVLIHFLFLQAIARPELSSAQTSSTIVDSICCLQISQMRGRDFLQCQSKPISVKSGGLRRQFGVSQGLSKAAIWVSKRWVSAEILGLLDLSGWTALRWCNDPPWLNWVLLATT